jgi:hypothetical protein
MASTENVAAWNSSCLSRNASQRFTVIGHPPRRQSSTDSIQSASPIDLLSVRDEGPDDGKTEVITPLPDRPHPPTQSAIEISICTEEW